MAMTAATSTAGRCTARLLLRPLQAGDLAPLFKIQQDPVAMRHTYVATSPDAAAQRLRAWEAERLRRGFAPWVVADRGTRAVLGWGGLGVDPFDPAWGPEVSYFLAPSAWGRGLATELVASTMSLAFDKLALPAVSAFAMADNHASLRVLEKCGFEFLCDEPALERRHYRLTRAKARAAA